MAEISNSTVFTNESIPSSSSDLLQQAFQQVVGDDDQGNEFVAFLQSDDNDSQTIHLTPAQAMALGLTFEVNPNQEVTYQQVDDSNVSGIQENLIRQESSIVEEQTSLSTSSTIALEQLNFQTGDTHKNDVGSLTKSGNINFEEWHIHDISHGRGLQEHNIDNGIRLSGINLQGQNECCSQIDQTELHTLKNGDVQVQASSNSNAQFTNEQNIVQNQQKNIISNSQAQILQKLPVLLPSSQFIIKPAQTILKPNKNIRLLHSSNKISNAVGNQYNTMHSIANNISSNSLLFSKATMVNTLQPQIVKAMPDTTQLINANAVSSQILAGACQITNQDVNPTQISNAVLNNISGAAQNIIVSPIRFSPLVKSSQTSSFKGNVQQFLTPVGKPSSNNVAKTSQIITNSGAVPNVHSTFLKSLQIPSQVIKMPGNIGKKGVTTTTAKNMLQTNSPVVIRSTSIVKAQDIKAVNTNSTSILRSTQNPSTVSILKPQKKFVFKNANKQNININSQNIGNITNGLKNLTQKSVSQINGTCGNANIIQNGITKQKNNSVSNGTSGRVQRKSKPTTINMVKPSEITLEATDTTKPLGSSENPIQIVQQGQTFHSVQRLTQTQLKQIAHVLQQRSQEAVNSNERVVYRVVFPEELDLRIRSPGNLVKNRTVGKRGRPKKNSIRSSVLPPKPTPIPDDEQEEIKDERKKVVARTRSGRLSRPPRHMVRDYKHLHHLDFLQPDLDDSDGGYSDYNTNSDKLEDEESAKDLLTGLEVPKRKISDHFRCPTCNKIYLGRTRMARHFEMHPDHGSPEQLPPSTPDPELKQANGQDPLKRKGKKRGPWAYVTPEAKSERRQIKLKEAISVCENVEIIKIATKPVLNAQSLFDLLVSKSENNVRNFLNELKQLMNKVREKAGIMLTAANEEEECHNKNLIDISEELLCDALGLNPGIYKINNAALRNTEESLPNEYSTDDPPLKMQKLTHSEETKDNAEERMSSGFSESSDLSVSDFINERRNDALTNPTCPEVLSALTLMRRNPSLVNNIKASKSNNVSKLLISNPEIQNQISDNPGFQKVDINTSKLQSFQKLEALKGLNKLRDNLDSVNCNSTFSKIENNYEPKLQSIEEALIKLEPMEQNYAKLEAKSNSSYQEENASSYIKVQKELNSKESDTENFSKDLDKLMTDTVPMTKSRPNSIKAEVSSIDVSTSKISPTSICKITDGLPILQDSAPIISANCNTNIFGGSENIDMNKITQYDHITHLDILNTSGTIDKNLLIDEKLVEQLHLVDQSNLVDELVSERLKNIMADNILESNLIPSNANLDAELDFEVLSEEFNRDTRS
ncbi:uncharacterized protein [Prorops nasuta]|uniref:uncharacterized protein isoform X2 n=1 Tax=Prorops nasuta TaxID=863751 RepID=UPI0034CF6C7A